MQELLPKEYEIIIQVRKRVFFKERIYPITISYQEGSFREILHFLSVCEEVGLEDAVFFFLHRNGLSKKYTKEMVLPVDLIEIYFFILKTYCRGFIDVEKMKKRVENMRKGEKVKSPPKQIHPDSSFIHTIISNSNETLNSLLSLTWSQIQFLQEGMTWNLNEQTKEGKRRNRHRARMNEMQKNKVVSDEEALEMAKAMEERIRKAEEKKNKQVAFGGTK